MAFFRSSIFIGIIFALLCCLLCILNTDSSIGFSGDDIQVINQAVAAASNTVGQFIKDYSFMNANNVDPVASNAYSWGTSFLLVPLYKLFGLNNILAFKGVIIGTYCLFIFSFFIYLAHKTDRIISGLITLFLATSPFFIGFTNDILKDLPYLLISFLSVVSIDYFLKESSLKKQIIYSIFVSSLLSLSVIFRENGALPVLVLFFAQLIKISQLVISKKEIRHTAVILYGLPYIITAVVYTLISIKYPTFYLKGFIDFTPASMIKMTGYYFNQFYLNFFAAGKIFSYILYCFVLVLSAYGIIKKVRHEYVLFIYLCTFIIYAAYPVEQEIRYIIPLIPVFFVFLGLGIYDFNNKYLKLTGIITLVVLCLFNVFVLSKMNLTNRFLYKHTDNGTISSSAKKVYDYINKNIPADSKIIYWHPRAIYLYTGRLSFQISDKKDKLKEGDYQISIIGKDRPGKYYDKEMYDLEAKTYIKEANVYLKPVYRNDNYAVYEIEKE